MRSAIRVRSYSATAPRINSSWSCVRVPSHRSVQKHHLAAGMLEFLQQHHELDVVARQAVGIGDQDLRHLTRPHRIAQPV